MSLAEFEDFWKQFMYVYAEITHEPLGYSPHSSDLVKSTFDYIIEASSKTNGRPKFVFSLDDYVLAKEKNQQLEHYMSHPEDFIKKLGDKREQTINLMAFTDYHAKVSSSFKEIFDKMAELNPEAAAELEPKFQSVFQN